MHLLFLAHRIPYPPNKGDKIRSFHQIKYLAEKGWTIHLCALADDPEDLRYADELKKYCRTVTILPLQPWRAKLRGLLSLAAGRSLSIGYFYDRRLQRAVGSILTQHPISAVLCFSSPMAEYVIKAGKLGGWEAGKPEQTQSGASSQLENEAASFSTDNGPRTSDHCLPSRHASDSDTLSTSELSSFPASQPPSLYIVDLVDVDSEKWKAYAVQKRPPASWLYGLEGKRLAAYEDAVVARFDASLLVTEAECAILRKRSPQANRVHALGNGVDLDYFRPRENASAQPRTKDTYLVFCGLMDYYPNVDAVAWFAREVLPLIRQQEPEVQFRIVGAKPSPVVASLDELPNVEVVGRVEDVRPYVQQAAVSVAPLRVARGVQNKVLEAMAMGKPVVATSQACEGIPAEPGQEILVADEAQDFAKAVLHLLHDEPLRREIGTHARAYVERNHSWEKNLDALHAMLLSASPFHDPQSL